MSLHKKESLVLKTEKKIEIMQFRKERKTRMKKKLKTVPEKCRTSLITPTYALNYNTRRIEREWRRKTYYKNID